MNSYQIAFLILVFLPPILSISIDKLTAKINVLHWVKWSDIIWKMYLAEWGLVMFWLVFYLLGTV